MKTVDIGRIGEDAAASLLKKQKLKVIERNIHISHNEIDIIAISKKQKLILFVEVKARTVDEDLYSPFGTPASAVTKEKQQRTLAAARGYMHSNKKYPAIITSSPKIAEMARTVKSKVSFLIKCFKNAHTRYATNASKALTNKVIGA